MNSATNARYGYDALNRGVTTTNALGQVSTVVYDATGNVVNVIDTAGNKGTMTYDALNRMVTSTNPLGLTTTMAYDTASNVISVTNARGYTTTYSYDALNRANQTQDANGQLGDSRI